jgi:hypothetical protein
MLRILDNEIQIKNKRELLSNFSFSKEKSAFKEMKGVWQEISAHH